MDVVNEEEEKIQKPVQSIIEKGRECSIEHGPGLFVMMGPSGCSKTRTSYEVLSMKLGFYFTSELGNKCTPTLFELILRK